MSKKTLLAAYLRQQLQLTMPDYVFSKEFSVKEFLQEDATPVQNKAAVFSKAAVKKTSLSNHSKPAGMASRLSTLRPVDQLIAKSEKNITDNFQSPSFKAKRKALTELYHIKCSNCHLADSRTKMVFGAGNVDAGVMVIGDAPGEDEDIQGVPFAGSVGQKLSQMLSAINLDRKKDLFITYVLKCRPPQDRSPEVSEIGACIPLLHKQISIIGPRAILLLGEIAAHALLGVDDSIENLRSKVHDYKGIPTMVIYHPAEILHNFECKKPAWEDLQKFQSLIEKLGIYGSSK